MSRFIKAGVHFVDPAHVFAYQVFPETNQVEFALTGRGRLLMDEGDAKALLDHLNPRCCDVSDLESSWTMTGPHGKVIHGKGVMPGREALGFATCESGPLGIGGTVTASKVNDETPLNWINGSGNHSVRLGTSDIVLQMPHGCSVDNVRNAFEQEVQRRVKVVVDGRDRQWVEGLRLPPTDPSGKEWMPFTADMRKEDLCRAERDQTWERNLGLRHGTGPLEGAQLVKARVGEGVRARDTEWAKTFGLPNDVQWTPSGFKATGWCYVINMSGGTGHSPRESLSWGATYTGISRTRGEHLADVIIQPSSIDGVFKAMPLGDDETAVPFADVTAKVMKRIIAHYMDAEILRTVETCTKALHVEAERCEAQAAAGVEKWWKTKAEVFRAAANVIVSGSAVST